jgi:hypothetical protein
VIVDATGDAPTALFLGAVAKANDKAFVSVEVFEGGIGALIASSVPGRDVPYSEGRAAFLAWCDAQNCPVPTSGYRRYEAVADDGTPFVADDAAVSIAAGHASRVILDIVDGKPAPRTGAWLLVGMSAEWVFDGHGCTIRLDVGALRETDGATVDQAALDFVLGLAKQVYGANPSPE